MTNTSDHNFEAWCSQHDCPPIVCWYEHTDHPRPPDYDFDKRLETSRL